MSNNSSTKDIALINEAESIQSILIRLEKIGLERASSVLTEIWYRKIILGSIQGILNGNQESLQSFLSYKNILVPQEELERLFKFLQELSEQFEKET